MRGTTTLYLNEQSQYVPVAALYTCWHGLLAQAEATECTCITLLVLESVMGFG